MSRDHVLERLRKLKAHADSAAEIGSEAEAQAFAAMFQKILLENKLEMTDIEFKAEEAAEPVKRHEIDYSKYPDWEDSRRRGTGWEVKLVSVIARAHFTRPIFYSQSNRVALVGRKSDVAVAEYMIITMVRTAEKIADKEKAKYSWEVYKRDRSTAAARGFKQAFLEGFVQRLFERYEDEKKRAASTSTALIRLSGALAAVDKWFEEAKKDKNSGLSDFKSMVRPSSNFEGRRRGRQLADSVSLRSNALTPEQPATRPRLSEK